MYRRLFIIIGYICGICARPMHRLCI